MIIEEKHNIPKKAKRISFFWDGSGSVEDWHRLLAVAIYDKDDNVVAGIGEIPSHIDKIDDVEISQQYKGEKDEVSICDLSKVTNGNGRQG